MVSKLGDLTVRIKNSLAKGFLFFVISISEVSHLSHGVDREREPVVELAIRMKAYQVVSEEAGSFPWNYQQNFTKYSNFKHYFSIKYQQNLTKEFLTLK